MNKEDFKFCPKCKSNTILIFEDCSVVECQNLNCCCVFNKIAYLEFLEYWEKLDHSLDIQWEKLRKKGKELGFDYSCGFEYIDAVGYSWEPEYGIYIGSYSNSELKDTKGKEPESWTEKEKKKLKRIDEKWNLP